MQTTAQLLRITDCEYDFVYFDHYNRWCQSVTINEQQFQSVLANASVNKYYNREYAKCEAEFHELIAQYPNVTAAEAMKLYGRCTFDMFNRRSPVLIEQAKKTQIINHLIAN